MGQRHREWLSRYEQLIGGLAPSLIEDAEAVDPAGRVCSPQGLAYGFIADVMSNMAQDALMAQASFGLSLEDMFISRGRLDDKLARAGQWAALPLRKSEPQHFDFSSAWAVESHARLTTALAARASHPGRLNASDRRTARIFVGQASADAVRADDYCVISDPSRLGSAGPVLCRESQLMDDRHEGRFLASVWIGSGWFGISKAILTTFTSTGTDVVIDEVPDAIDVLRLTCPAIVPTPPA
jgi:hypothetical protein